jgi:predicted MFS family arabinose efflux permease
MFGGWLAQHFDWRIAFMVVGAPGLLVAAIVRFTLKEPERPTEYHAFQKTSRSSIKEALGWMFSFPSFRHLAMGTTLLAIVGYGFGQWAPSFLVRTYDVSIGYAGFSLGIVLGVGGGVGTFLGGYLSDRLSTKGDRRWYLWMPGLAALLYVPLSWLFYFSDRVEVSLFLMFVPVALSVSFVGPVHALTQAIAGPNRRAMASGIVILLMTLVGLGLGPQVVGLISDLLNPAFGVNSLKYALLCVTTTAAAWSAAHYLLAARHIRSDLERASTNAVLTR